MISGTLSTQFRLCIVFLLTLKLVEINTLTRTTACHYSMQGAAPLRDHIYTVDSLAATATTERRKHCKSLQLMQIPPGTLPRSSPVTNPSDETINLCPVKLDLRLKTVLMLDCCCVRVWVWTYILAENCVRVLSMQLRKLPKTDGCLRWKESVNRRTSALGISSKTFDAKAFLSRGNHLRFTRLS